MASLYESLSEEDRQKVDKWAEERKNPKHDTDIPPEFYTIAELGFYYGWGAVESFYRGYIESKDDQGNFEKLPFPLPLAMGFVKAAQKFHYRQIIDSGDIMAAANLSSRTKTYANNVIEYANKRRKQANET